MKVITYSKIGYNAPRSANWSWGIFKVDLVDTNNAYCMSYTVKEQFGGDSRFRNAMEAKGFKVIETKGVYPSQKCTGIASMPVMDSEEFINEVATTKNY